jgi:hypothetical protein
MEFPTTPHNCMNENLSERWEIAVKIKGRWESATCGNKHEATSTLTALLDDYDGEIEEIKIVGPRQEIREHRKADSASGTN